jgi:hypothetical protein
MWNLDNWQVFSAGSPPPIIPRDVMPPSSIYSFGPE